jgi:hypothetical protein
MFRVFRVFSCVRHGSSSAEKCTSGSPWPREHPPSTPRCPRGVSRVWAWDWRRGLLSFPFPLNLSLHCPILLNISLLCPPYNPSSQINPWSVPRVLKLRSNVSDVFPEVLNLSSEVSECKPLRGGRRAAARGGVGPPRPGRAVQLTLSNPR